MHLPKGEKLLSEFHFSPESDVLHCVLGWLLEASEHGAGKRFDDFSGSFPTRKVVMA